MTKPNVSFAEHMKEYQISWACRNGLSGLLEQRKDKKSSWVLKVEHKRRNLKDPSWWHYIEEHEHRWARSLLSSQCFAVNLFGPLRAKPILAKKILGELLPHRTIEKDDKVSVLFERTPKDAPAWLGETRQTDGRYSQPTQVDVFFTVQRFKKPIGYLLVEVKFTEGGFGSCRGASESTPKKPGNPDSSRCLDLQSVIANPKERCWMAGKENGRRYWEYMLPPHTPFNFPAGTACPFRHSLYQLMRNQVLAVALVQKTTADWADFGVCLHPSNNAVRQLLEPLAGQNDAVRAFNLLLPDQKRVIEIEPLRVVQSVRDADSAYAEWGDWIVTRYDLR